MIRFIYNDAMVRDILRGKDAWFSYPIHLFDFSAKLRCKINFVITILSQIAYRNRLMTLLRRLRYLFDTIYAPLLHGNATRACPRGSNSRGVSSVLERGKIDRNLFSRLFSYVIISEVKTS